MPLARSPAIEIHGGIAPGSIPHDIPIAWDRAGCQLREIDEFVGRQGKIEICLNIIVRADNGDQILAAASALRSVCVQLSAQALQL